MEGRLSATAARGAESWQFFAFVFGAIVMLAFALIDELPVLLLRLVLKACAFLGIGYLTLVNVSVRNFLVGVLGAFKRERHF